LRLPQIAVATAQAILHRFYFRKSFIRCEMVTVATAALFIAAKVEESPRKIKDVLTVTDYVMKLKKGERDVLDISSFHYTDTKQEIFEAERYILKEIGFATEALSESNVHQYLYFYLRDVLKGSKQLAQKAWNYVNDAYRTTVIVCFPPNVVACAAIYLAGRVINYPFPSDP